jgi:hypothetical protein
MEEFTIYYGTPQGKDKKIGVDSSYPARIKKQKIHGWADTRSSYMCL